MLGGGGGGVKTLNVEISICLSKTRLVRKNVKEKQKKEKKRESKIMENEIVFRSDMMKFYFSIVRLGQGYCGVTYHMCKPRRKLRP